MPRAHHAGFEGPHHVLYRKRHCFALGYRSPHQRLFQGTGVPKASRGEKFQVMGETIW